MKLISMTEFVLEESNGVRKFRNDIFQIRNYAQFLKQPLKLEMFVPCDDNENVLEYPKWENEETDYEIQILAQQYEQAKEKVLFEFDGGLTLLRNKENFFIIEDKNGVYYRVLKNKPKTTIEDLFKFSVDIKLTQNATKQFL